MRSKFGVGKKSSSNDQNGTEESSVDGSMASMIQGLRGMIIAESMPIINLHIPEAQKAITSTQSKSSSQPSGLNASSLALLEICTNPHKARLNHMISAEIQEPGSASNAVHGRFLSETPSSLCSLDFPVDSSHLQSESIHLLEESPILSKLVFGSESWLSQPQGSGQSLGKTFFNAINTKALPKVNLNENHLSFGSVVLIDDHLKVYESYISHAFCSGLKITSHQSLSYDSAAPIKCVTWPSTIQQSEFEISPSGKLVVKKGTLFSLVSLLISQESIADIDYLPDILSTYRYFSHPVDLCRILILRYMEIHHNLVSDSFYAGKSQSESSAFTQMRVLNVLKKWTNDYAEDFQDFEELDILLCAFLQTYVVPDQKRTIFATNMLDRIADRETAKRQSLASNSNIIPLDRSDTLNSNTSLPGIPSTSLAAKRNSKVTQSSTMASIDSEDAISDKRSVYEPPGKNYMKTRSGSMDFLRKVPLISTHKLFSPTRSSMSASIDAKRTSFMSEVQLIEALFIGDFDPEVIAKQLTVLEQQQFCAIPIHEFYNQKWNSKNKEALAPNLTQYIQWFNHVASSFAAEVVKQPKLKKRVSTLKRIIYIAQACLSYQNYNSCVEIVAGLQSASIQRLKQTWEALPKKYMDVWENVNAVVSSETYRSALLNLKESLGDKPMIPFLGVNLSDLTFTEDGNPTYTTTSTTEHLVHQVRRHAKTISSANTTPFKQHIHPIPLRPINFEKFKLISNLLHAIQTLQQAPKYSFPRDALAEDWLLNHFVPYKEADLYTLSIQCEPRSLTQ